MSYIYKKLLIFCVLILLLFSKINVAWAVGLGELKVYSYLNEPLNAEIILNGLEEVDLNNILVELASAKDFMRTGIPRPFFLTKLKFEVLRNNNITVIHISTVKAVKDPLIDLLLQVVWPDGKIVKNYAILLDPSGEQSTKREIPLSQQNIKNKASSALLGKKEFSDAIFATSLEDSMENEISLEHKQQINAIANQAIAAAPAITNEIDPDEAIEHKVIDDNSKNKVLDQVASSIQIFSQPKRTNVDYEKLLDLKPTVTALHKDLVPLAENLAMSQVNSELEALRNKNNNLAANTSNTLNNQEPPKKYFKHLDLIKNYGNDLLWTCFLASATIFLIYKMLNQEHAVTIEPVKEQKKEPVKHQEYITEKILEPKVEIKQDSYQKNYQPYSLSGRNEELELKIALAKQYLEVGDRHSAQDILEDLNVATIKEPKYKEQIDSLLKCLA